MGWVRRSGPTLLKTVFAAEIRGRRVVPQDCVGLVFAEGDKKDFVNKLAVDLVWTT